MVCGTIQTGEIGVVESMGKFSYFVDPGFFCLNPLYCEAMVNRISVRVQQLNCVLETKTKDNVFVSVTCAIQYQVVKERIYEANYVLENVEQTMRAYVADTVRAEMCSLKLDEAFAAKDEISSNLKSHLSSTMNDFGYLIMQALITDLTPDSVVRSAMNEINAAKRQKEAAYQKAEGEKLIRVKQAEAAAESMYLSGVGVANQRKAIMNGLKASIVEFNAANTDTTAKEVMDLLVLNQYFDTLQDIGQNRNSRTVFTSSPDEIRDGEEMTLSRALENIKVILRFI